MVPNRHQGEHTESLLKLRVLGGEEMPAYSLHHSACLPILASFENCQLALEFSGKDIKIRQENFMEYRINNAKGSFVVYETSGKLKTMESL